MNVPVGAAGVRGLGGRGYLAYTGLGRGYQVKGDKREDKLYDLLPGMELTPMNPVTLKPQGIKLAPQVCNVIPEAAWIVCISWVKDHHSPFINGFDLIPTWGCCLVLFSFFYYIDKVTNQPNIL